MEELILLKCPYYLKQSTDSVENSNVIFHRNRKSYKIYMKSQKPKITKTILRNNNKAGGITLSDFKLCYKAIVIKSVCYWQISRHIDQWNKIDSPKIRPCKYTQLIYKEIRKNIQRGKESLFSKWCWENGLPTKRMKLDTYFIPYTKTTQNGLKT